MAAHTGLYGRLVRRSVSFSVPPGDSRAAKDIAERPSNSPPLELPPLEEVERSLDLDSEDRGTIPGLYNLNVERMPVRRLVGMQVLIAFCFFHNNLVFGDLMLPRLIWVGALLEAYAVTQFVVLRRWFIRFEQFHLGTFYLVANIAVLTLSRSPCPLTSFELVATSGVDIRHRGRAQTASSPPRRP